MPPLRFASSGLRDTESPYFALNGDILTWFPLDEFTAYHREKGGLITLALAQYHLGLCYLRGNGVPRDQAQAAAWFHKAAAQGNALAQFQLGLRYWVGQGVTPALSQAAAWFQKAAEQGHADAQFILGPAVILSPATVNAIPSVAQVTRGRMRLNMAATVAIRMRL